MRKIAILVVLMFMYATISPAQMLAAGDAAGQTETPAGAVSDEVAGAGHSGAAEGTAPDSGRTSGEYNELGIKKGTKVYGVDISKLSKEELQYIPKDWRDGVFEEAESADESKNTVRLMSVASYPDVNEYIAAKHLPTAKVEYHYVSVFPNFPYRNGYGKVEGIVVHETASDGASLNEEIAYETRTYNNAFVHGFVDDSRAVIIHPTDNAAWGAGPYANARFIHIELVRVNTFDKFARSVNNDANLMASLLLKYHLGVDSADSDGKGTLWPHAAVSKFLGGTNHSDPIGYFARWGYSFSDYVKLVKAKYEKLNTLKVSSTSRLAHIKNSKVKIYKSTAKNSSYITAGSKYTGQVYYIKKQAKNYTDTYYLISTKPSSQDGIIGWVRSSDLVTYANANVDKNPKTLYFNGSGIAYNRAWGDQKNIVKLKLSDHILEEFHVNLTESVGKNIWYRGTWNGKTLWLHSSHLWIPKVSSTSRLAQVRGSGVKIYQKIGAGDTAILAGNTYTDQVFYSKKQTILGDKTYYLLSTKPSSTKGVIGWVAADDVISYANANIDKDRKTLYIKSGVAYNRAFGGKKNLVIADLSKYQMKEFHVNLTERVGKNIWYRGVLNGKTLWIHESHLVRSLSDFSSVPTAE